MAELSDSSLRRLSRMLADYEAGMLGGGGQRLPTPIHNQVGTPYVKAKASTDLAASSTLSVTCTIWKYNGTTVAATTLTQDAYDWLGDGVGEGDAVSLFRSYDATTIRWYFLSGGLTTDATTVKPMVKFKLAYGRMTNDTSSINAQILEQYGKGIDQSATSITVHNISDVHYTLKNYFEAETSAVGFAVRSSGDIYRAVFVERQAAFAHGEFNSALYPTTGLTRVHPAILTASSTKHFHDSTTGLHFDLPGYYLLRWGMVYTLTSETTQVRDDYRHVDLVINLSRFTLEAGPFTNTVNGEVLINATTGTFVAIELGDTDTLSASAEPWYTVRRLESEMVVF